MLLSVALVILISLMMSKLAQMIKIPSIIGMLIAGILLGPYVMNLIDGRILELSADLRQIALIVILLRAGLALKLEDLKKIGKPALFMAFLPATFEIIGVIILAQLLFSLSFLEAAILGSILSAVSPAVVVPRMIKLMESGHGKAKRIPQLILSGASLDDVYVIILFTSFLQSFIRNDLSLNMIYQIPTSIIIGIGLGLVMGIVTVILFKKLHMRDTIKVLILFSIAFLFIALEENVKPYVLVSGLLAVMTLGGTIHHQYPVLAKRLVSKFEKIWVIAEIMLFVLVGAAVDTSVIPSVGMKAILLIFGALIFRMVGVMVSLLITPLNIKEKLFVAIAYIPKATVQAAIGAIPLSLGLDAGYLILTVAVLAIIITAPLGAILIDYLSPRLLKVENTILGENGVQ